jgi:glycosyltransferase involved in cell wall biosynthesis
VLRNTLRQQRVFDKALVRSVPYLPHGIETQVFQPRPLEEADPGFQQWVGQLPKASVIVGAVATNQPRKDLGLLFQTVAELKRMGLPAVLWLQTDLITKVWDVGELAVQCAFAPREVFISTQEIRDTELAARYTASHVTIAPGLGEGFGYPIVESLSCGTPVVHGNYAGGVDLIPMAEMLVEPTAWRLDSIYALLRPVIRPLDMATAASKLIRDRLVGPQIVARYCRGSVAHLEWRQLWPRWRAWIRKGLEIRNGRGSGQTDPTRAVRAPA